MPPREPTKVNLDALITRQDMETGKPQSVPENFTFKPNDLHRKHGMTYAILRKPDFQRSTSSWTPEKVKDMVVAYLEGETIPAVIVWRSPKNDLFVIDGAHRLSSIIAWINDDYGDGEISKKHYGEPKNAAAASKTRDLIALTIGSYQELIEAHGDPNAKPIHKENAKKLVFASLKVQELEKVSDVATAETSFLKINEQGVVLSETEKWLINARFCPNSIAARAISLKGTGGAYWMRFSNEENKKQIANLSASVYRLLFTPDLDVGEMKTADLPIAGAHSSANALNLIFQFVNFANDVPTKPPADRKEAEKIVPKDPDGAATIQFLKNAQRTASLLTNLRNTNYSRSLDLHPFVYFYSHQGNHQPTMFLATAYWLRDLDKKKRISELARSGLRENIENFILNHAFLIPAISRRARGEERAVRLLKKFLDVLFENVYKVNTSDLLEQIGKTFKVLTVAEPDEDEEPMAAGSRIPIHVKNALFINHELESAKKCEMCKARIPARGLSSDHRHDRKHGGDGTRKNVAPMHHACNSAKDKLLKKNKQ